ncbi:MAG: iron (metal) dependent repressor, DtxR family, partial [Thermomicrobiales bacterium]|nr:iron (metal) dependent repressor, DtxR family [Thermomicrobiales bacterium]
MMNAMNDRPRAAGEETPETVSPDAPRITHAMEDYLKAIYRLQGDGGQVTMQRLTEELDLSGPSVTNMVKRLHELELVRHMRYRDVALTSA